MGIPFYNRAKANFYANAKMRQGFTVSMSRERPVTRMSGWNYIVWIE